MIEFVSWAEVLAVLVVLGFIAAGFYCGGTLVADRRALEKIRKLRAKVDSGEAAIAALNRELAQWRNPFLTAELEEGRLTYEKLRDACAPYSKEREFNRGVIHGFNAALLKLRGWI